MKLQKFWAVGALGWGGRAGGAPLNPPLLLELSYWFKTDFVPKFVGKLSTRDTKVIEI